MSMSQGVHPHQLWGTGAATGTLQPNLSVWESSALPCSRLLLLGAEMVLCSQWGDFADTHQSLTAAIIISLLQASAFIALWDFTSLVI